MYKTQNVRLKCLTMRVYFLGQTLIKITYMNILFLGDVFLIYTKKRMFIMFFLLIILGALIGLNTLKEVSNKQKEEKEKIEEEEENKQAKQLIEYKANQTIRVKLCGTGEIVAMDVNDYLRGVLPSEMPPYYNIEALKAQAIVARTYLYRKMSVKGEGEECDICDNYAHCQAFYNKEKILSIWKNKEYDDALREEYWNNVNEAVVGTQDEVILYNGEYIRAYFHASSPIKTESSTEVWGREYIPYLVSVENKEAEDYANRQSIVEISYEEFLSKLKEKIDKNCNIESLKKGDIKINENTASGRVKNISVCGNIISAELLRTVYGLRSTMFSLEETDSSIKFNVIGNGHGLGLSQVGADYYGKNGMDYKEIIKHYYTGVEVVKL